MSKRAEEAALKAYPQETKKAIELLPRDWNKPKRTAFIQGYEQAEKDLALTWEDAKLIYHIADELEKEGCIKRNRLIGCKFWSEVLRRFNVQREKK